MAASSWPSRRARQLKRAQVTAARLTGQRRSVAGCGGSQRASILTSGPDGLGLGEALRAAQAACVTLLGL